MMTTEHPLLTAIRAGVAEGGSHSQHWGDLRRQAFIGDDAWTQLKNWCADNAFECQLGYSHSPKLADVQFRKLRNKAVETTPAG